jgi:hypothetical protein
MQDAAAEARLAEMLGCNVPYGSQSAVRAGAPGVRESDCDIEMLKEIESWGMPHEFVMRSFKTFPYNHCAASYAVLEHRKAMLQ